ncbi:hypothetical protein K450DRAFT_248709 [Umbelopsis ramanniana AG]|uniref:HRDC domain-containing protein n=1 Tax=Umbelopsis ramanniana AG TaxID=1314678 RepID=A0AAD5E614_UMBRA|nr:uncharacterized protein K450DRAFT_248709 [Umbelopsis ramanniana AG]KAI8578031.1 hypothetical protein K450DRAFT_248709 [Umbelopsis ramanniana AG]
MGWSGGSAIQAGRQQQSNESQQIKDIKVKCLQEMKEKRRQLVISQRLARPSTVFTDTQLKMMAQRLPTNMLQFLQIDPDNITDDKFERYGSIFLNICKDHAAMVQSLQ